MFSNCTAQWSLTFDWNLASEELMVEKPSRASEKDPPD